MAMPHRVDPGTDVQLKEIEADGKKLHDDRDAAEKEFKKYRKKIAELQARLYAEERQKLLIVFQAMDAGGKDGTTRAVFEGVNPQGVRVVSFKQPSHRELAHDFLWRIHFAVPPKGMIHVFNRSQYEDVLVVRVRELAPKEIWEPRFEQINQFEKYLSDTGTRILKFYLHITKDEQKERFEERIDIPEKNWKFSKQDLVKRGNWDHYRNAYEDVLSKCSTKHAPWYIIPANQNWYRNWVIAKTICHTLEEMDPQYPEPEDGLDDVVIH
ncbi:polyphosphate kinase 2 family protein [Thalassoglobus sp. JC818]|uniref:polyphosphate kinase 2 family protein n=1 Tax=Thalassoglobus sp. JC818 TaxID=3232136 RepID=UPI003459BC24